MAEEQLQFSKDETAKIRQIAEYYRVAKELIIYGEQIDPNGATLPQTLSERTNAFDHIMRVVVEKQGMKDKPVENSVEYNSTNLDKAFGHTYRAAYDALDWVSLTIQERIAKDINSFSLETIQAVIPDYFATIKPGLEKILRSDITRLRNEKDVADNNEENLKEYVRVVAELKKLFDQVDIRLGSLVDYEAKHKQSVIKNRIWEIGVAIVLLIVGWILGKLTGN